MEKLIKQLMKYNIQSEIWNANGNDWLLMYDDQNELVLCCRYDGKNYIVSDNCTKAIYLGIHFELDLTTPEEVIKEYYKYLL